LFNLAAKTDSKKEKQFTEIKLKIWKNFACDNMLAMEESWL